MGSFNLELLLDRKLDLRLNSFKNKSRCILQRAALLSSCLQNFTLQENTSNDRQTFDWMNSIKFKASLVSAKHWTYTVMPLL